MYKDTDYHYGARNIGDKYSMKIVQASGGWLVHSHRGLPICEVMSIRDLYFYMRGFDRGFEAAQKSKKEG